MKTVYFPVRPHMASSYLTDFGWKNSWGLGKLLVMCSPESNSSPSEQCSAPWAHTFCCRGVLAVVLHISQSPLGASGNRQTDNSRGCGTLGCFSRAAVTSGRVGSEGALGLLYPWPNPPSLWMLPLISPKATLGSGSSLLRYRCRPPYLLPSAEVPGRGPPGLCLGSALDPGAAILKNMGHYDGPPPEKHHDQAWGNGCSHWNQIHRFPEEKELLFVHKNWGPSTSCSQRISPGSHGSTIFSGSNFPYSWAQVHSLLCKSL